MQKQYTPITPKSLNALQRLLQQNNPLLEKNHVPINEYSNKNQHKSSEQQSSSNQQFPFHKPTKIESKQTKKLKEMMQVPDVDAKQRKYPDSFKKQIEGSQDSKLSQSQKIDDIQHSPTIKSDPLSRLLSSNVPQGTQLKKNQRQPNPSTSDKLDIKVELLRVLGDTRGQGIKTDKKREKVVPQTSKASLKQFNILNRRTGNSLNQLLQPVASKFNLLSKHQSQPFQMDSIFSKKGKLNNKEESPQISSSLQNDFVPSSERNGSYKQKRPPELMDIEQNNEEENKNKQQSPNYNPIKLNAASTRTAPRNIQLGQREVQTTVNKSNKNQPQHFIFSNEVVNSVKSKSKNNDNVRGSQTTTNARPGCGGGGYNMFGSLNEVLRQYIQAKSSQERSHQNENMAGTGEGIRINESSKFTCQSARNANNNPVSTVQQQPQSEQKPAKRQTPRNQNSVNDTNHMTEKFSRLYIKTAKILNSYKAKELQWKREKSALRDEILFLKTLLKQSHNIKSEEPNNFDYEPESGSEVDDYE